jgi:Fe-Mn family superoxide dismutase
MSTRDIKQFSEVADQHLYPFILPNLPYGQDSLMPYLTAETLDYHHKKHHQTYVTNLNNLLAEHPLKNKTLEAIIHEASSSGLNAIFNNAAQVWNHTFYWHSMKPKGGGTPSDELYTQICQDFGSFETFSTEFKQHGAGQFGSGWVWLVSENDKLKIVKTANAENPITKNQFPILTCDVWEHAYYIDYRNKRADYLNIFMESLVNWDFANQNFMSSKK